MVNESQICYSLTVSKGHSVTNDEKLQEVTYEQQEE